MLHPAPEWEGVEGYVVFTPKAKIYRCPAIGEHLLDSAAAAIDASIDAPLNVKPFAK